VAAIKLTLGTDVNARAPSIEDEARWMKEAGPLCYPLGRNRPVHAEEGDCVYFIRAGKMVARAKADRFCQLSGSEERYTFTGEVSKTRGWQVECSRMELAKKPIAFRGFQGFRYVSRDEQICFESAFA
jgi:hypothetical protein